MLMVEDYYNYFGIEFDSDILEKRRNIIYLILGFDCNLRCNYCLHTHHFDRKMPSTISPKVLHFLKTRIPSKVKSKLNLQFWGGEPLLYFDKIKFLVEELKDTGAYTFAIVTNGTYLTQEIVDFCNDNEVVIGVSHDGVLNNYNRGYDPIEDKHELINSIKYFSGFSAVMTPENKSYYEITDYFRSCDLLTEDKKRCRVVPVLDVSLGDVAKFNDEFHKEMKKVVDNLKNNLIMGNVDCQELDIFKSGIASYLMKKKYPEVYKDVFTTYTMMLDLEGNLYYNSGGSYKLGDINTPLEDIKKNFIETNNKYFGRWEKCLACRVKPICNGGNLGVTKDGINLCDTSIKYLSPLVDFIDEVFKEEIK